MSPSSAPAPPGSAPRGRWRIPVSRCWCWRRATGSAAAPQRCWSATAFRSTSAANGCIRATGIPSCRSPSNSASRSTARVRRWSDQTYDLGFPPDDHAAFNDAQDAFYDRVAAAAELDHDTAASQWLEPGNRWNPLIDAVSTYINGAELDRVSVYDTDAYLDTGHQLAAGARLRRADRRLWRALPGRAELRSVELIDHSGPRIRLDTSRGTLHARASDRHRADQPDRRRDV